MSQSLLDTLEILLQESKTRRDAQKERKVLNLSISTIFQPKGRLSIMYVIYKPNAFIH